LAAAAMGAALITASGRFQAETPVIQGVWIPCDNSLEG
jgi:hypothetical protein